MPVSHATTFFDVHDAKVYPLTADSGASATYGAGIDVPGIAEVGVDPNFASALLKGDAKVIARKSSIESLTLSATYGKLSLDVLQTVLGMTVTDNASTSAKAKLKGNNAPPAFKFAFSIEDVDLGLGNITCTLYKCTVTGGTLFSSSTDEFGQPTLEIQADPLTSTDDIMDIDFYATLTPLP